MGSSLSEKTPTSHGSSFIAESRAVVIHGAEHYLERNGFLTCSAAPVFGPRGQLRGVLDISVDHNGYHPHTLGKRHDSSSRSRMPMRASIRSSTS